MKAVLCTLALAGLTSAACAADMPARKPGLWEITNKTLMDGKAPAMPKLDNLPPEQRAQIEKMMAEKGMSMPGSGPGGATVTKMCLTKEEAMRKDPPLHTGGEEKCEHKVTKQTASMMAFTYVCTGRHASRGEGEARFESDSRYSGWLNATTEDAGQQHKMRMEYSARWLGADCGNIKPFAMPKR